MFSKSKADSNPRNWQPLFYTVYELARSLAWYQPFDKRKEKITPGIYLGMTPIHVIKLSLLLILSMGIVWTQLHVAFYPSLTTINGRDLNRVPTRYWTAMCGFVKGKKLLFVHYEKYDP